MSIPKALAGALLLAFVVRSGAVEAASERVFVAGSGHDTPNCGSLQNPCRSLETAVARVVSRGEIQVVDGGPFAGTTITKSMTITAASGVGLITLGWPGLYVSASAADVVVLKNLSLKGDPETIIAVQLGAGRSLVVEDCVFSGMNTAVAATAGHTVLRRTTVRGAVTGVDAIAAQEGSRIRLTVDECVFEGNWSGVDVRDGASATITRSRFSDNVSALMTIAGTGASAQATVDDCIIAGNLGGVFANSSGGTSTMWLANTTVAGNTSGIQVNEATLFSFGNNTISGNDTDGEDLVTPIGPR